VEGNGNKGYVFVPDADQRHIQKILVTVDFIKDKSAFVSEGLDGVSHVITSGSGFLTSSSLVSIQ
jgi:hypothetical protein